MSVTKAVFRENVRAELEADLGITFESGFPLFDRSEDRSIGYVWIDGVDQDSGDANIEQITLVARVYMQWKQQQGMSRPVDEFEGLIDQIQASLRDKQTQLGPWLFDLNRLEPDYENMTVTATLTGIQDNAFAA